MSSFTRYIQLSVTSLKDGKTLTLARPNYDLRDFFFDSVLATDSEQETAYEEIAKPVVQDVL